MSRHRPFAELRCDYITVAKAGATNQLVSDGLAQIFSAESRRGGDVGPDCLVMKRPQGSQPSLGCTGCTTKRIKNAAKRQKVSQYPKVRRYTEIPSDV